MSGETPWDFGSAVPRGAGEARELEPGEVVDEAYRIDALLGKGGMARVYQARDLRGDRDVALKVLRGAQSDRLLARLEREGELTAGLRHPGIVRIHAAGRLEGQTYLVYELVREARTLTDLLRTGLPRPERLRVFREVVDALAHAHAAGVVHRDLKPDNILIGTDGAARVADFGIATQEGLARITQTGELVGTPRFMAPEQLKGKVATEPTADVWSLGVILYELLTDEHPFPAANFAELVGRMMRTSPPPPRQVDASVSASLERVCLRCLRRDPAERYEDAGALLDAFTAAELEAPPARRAAAGMAIAGVLLIAGAAATVAITSIPAASAPESALRAALARQDREAVARALEAGGGEARADRFEARLFLAGAAAPLRERVKEAEAACALASGPGEQARAERARAEVLGEAGRHAEAAEAWSRVAAARPEAPVLLAWARALAAAGRFVAAAGLLDDVGGRWAAAALRVRLGALLEAGERADAAALAGRAGGTLPAVEAQAWRLEAGGDAAAKLEALARKHPVHPAPAAALARLFVRRGDLGAAREALAAAIRRGVRDPDLARRSGELRALLAQPPDTRPAVRTGEPLRSAAVRYHLARGERELAFRARVADPRVLRPEGAPTVGDHEVRGRSAFAAARALASDALHKRRARRGLAAFEPPGSDARRAHLKAVLSEAPGDGRARLLAAEDALRRGDGAAALRELRRVTEQRHRIARAWVEGRALLATGRAREAVGPLRRALTVDMDDAPRLAVLIQALQSSGGRAEADRLRARLSVVRGARRAEARARLRRLEKGRRKRGTELVHQYGEVIELDPLLREARYQRGLLLTHAAAAPGLRDCIRAITQDTQLLSRLTRTLGVVAHGGPFLSGSWIKQYGESDRNVIRGERPVSDAREMFRDARFDRLAHLVARVHLIEQERRRELIPSALERLDAYLERFPAAPAAWILRARVLLCERRISEAARDLALATEVAPHAAVAWFYVGVLRASRGESSDAVLAAIRRAGEGNFDVWKDDGFDPAVYPALEPYLRLEPFRFLRKPR